MPLKCVTPKEFNKGLWYTIDPGVHTAVQIWRDGEMLGHKVIDLTKEKTIDRKVDRLIQDLKWIAYGKVLIEGVSLRTGSLVSMASGARGNLFLLSYIVGMIIAVCKQNNCYVYDPILYQEWAGQLSYSQLRTILRKKFNCDCTNEHIAAARGIGYAAKGEL